MKRIVYKSGEITVFMSLIFLVTIGFLGAVIQSIRHECAKSNIQSIVECSLKSAFSEYNRELLDRYGLLYVDTTYKGVTTGGEDSLSGHISRYIDVNTSDSSASIYSLKFISVIVSDVEYANDEDYESLMNQIRIYMTKVRGYSSDIPNELLLDEYLRLFFVTDSELPYENLSYSDKKLFLAQYIEQSMYENYGYFFDFSKHIDKACITAYFEDGSTVYECKRYYSLAKE